MYIYIYICVYICRLLIIILYYNILLYYTILYDYIKLLAPRARLPTGPAQLEHVPEAWPEPLQPHGAGPGARAGPAPCQRKTRELEANK